MLQFPPIRERFLPFREEFSPFKSRLYVSTSGVGKNPKPWTPPAHLGGLEGALEGKEGEKYDILIIFRPSLQRLGPLGT